MAFTPRSITIHETDPASVNRYSLYCTAHGTSAPILASRDYAVAGVDTVLPIGTDGFFTPVVEGTVVDFWLIERAAPGASSDDVTVQVQNGQGYAVHALPNGPESVTVQE